MFSSLLAAYDFNNLGATLTGVASVGYLAYRLVIANKKAIESDYHKEQVDYLVETITSKDATIDNLTSNCNRLQNTINEMRTRQVDEISKRDQETERLTGLVRELRKELMQARDDIDSLTIRISKYETP